MKTKTTKRTLAIIMSAAVVLSGLAVGASAKSLADCFTSGSNKSSEYVDYGLGQGENYYYKTAWGKTENYGSSHYIRAYVTKDFLGDSGRVWSKSPHNSHYVESDKVFTGTGIMGSLGIGYTAYAKYGTANS